MFARDVGCAPRTEDRKGDDALGSPYKPSSKGKVIKKDQACYNEAF